MTSRPHRAAGAGAFAAALLSLCATAGAAPDDPLWRQAQSQMDALRPYVAGQVDVAVQGSGLRSREDYSAALRLTAWQGGQPQRDAQALRGKPLNGMSDPQPNGALNAADHPERSLLAVETVERGDSLEQDGQRLQQFKVSGSLPVQELVPGNTRPHAPHPFSGEVWVTADRGTPVRARYQVQGLPFTPEFVYSVSFQADPASGLNLPRTSRLQVRTELPLIGATTLDRQWLMQDWQRRPQDTSSITAR